MTDDAPTYTLLVVEDDPHTLELLVFNLSDAGYRVLAAENVQEALDYLEEEPVELILSDVMMPGLSGFEFREMTVKDPALREVAFIFLTAKATPEDQIRGLETGVDEYITKPFDIDVLLARIQAVITRRELFAKRASTDSLTGLLNRQALERAITREMNRMLRYPAAASLVFLDIDNFKSINDTYGHAIGDRILLHLADVLETNGRSVDIVGRFGGEEFVVFFPETNEAAATAVVQRMQRQFGIPCCDEVKEPLTFSAGIAEAPRDGNEFHVLCDRADAAMYSVKRSGKARVATWRPGMTPAAQ